MEGNAHRDGRLCIGDRILEINGEDFSSRTLAEAMLALGGVVPLMRLTIYRECLDEGVLGRPLQDMDVHVLMKDVLGRPIQDMDVYNNDLQLLLSFPEEGVSGHLYLGHGVCLGHFRTLPIDISPLSYRFTRPRVD